MKPQNIRQLVIARRDAMGMTNYELARLAGKDVTSLARWLEPSRADARDTISTATLEPVLAVLGLKISEYP